MVSLKNLYNLDERIKKAIDIIENDNYDSFDKIYDFTTENIQGYIDNFNLNNKSLMTVGSSADQVINAILKNCKNITVIDLCPFVEHYYNLKKAGILSFSYLEFLNYFYDIGNGSYSKSLFSKNYYSKLRQKLGDINYQSLLFWDFLYQLYDPKLIRYKLFQDNIFNNNINALINYNPYLANENVYNNVKLKIRNVTPKFINEDILNIPNIKLDRNFDNILLSNIYDYVRKDKVDLMRFKITLNELTKYLELDGKLLTLYLYNTDNGNAIKELKQNKLLDNLNYDSITGMASIFYNSIEYECYNEDTIVTYQKTKKR